MAPGVTYHPKYERHFETTVDECLTVCSVSVSPFEYLKKKTPEPTSRSGKTFHVPFYRNLKTKKKRK